MNARKLLIPLGAVLLLWASACNWPWPFDDPLDPHRCDPPCEGKEKCIDGQCQIPPDGGIMKKKDSAPSGCGNKLCEGNETSKSCPTDCPKCINGKLECVNSVSIKECKDETWRTYICDYLCKQDKKYGHGVGCFKQSTGHTCMCGGYYGFVCDLTSLKTKPCNPDLKCIKVGQVPGTKGFCTKTCTVVGAKCDTPAEGYTALCAWKLGDGTLYCGFDCNNTKKLCPQGMWCDKWENNLCKPNQ